GFHDNALTNPWPAMAVGPQGVVNSYRAGYFKDHFPKIEVARAIASCMNPDVNRSASFRAFRCGLEALLSRLLVGEVA
ncbi:MAG: hypothetical protein HQL82_13335, partial [Magnetococcales bacterium]|nr:hypothetical protein [Magnetococcales bacterium]